MLHFFRLEWTKMKRSRISYFLTLLLAIVITTYFFYIDKKSTSLEEIEMYVSENVLFFEEYVDSMEEDIDNLSPMEKEVLDNLKRQYKGFQIMQKGLIERNWNLYWQGVY